MTDSFFKLISLFNGHIEIKFVEQDKFSIYFLFHNLQSRQELRSKWFEWKECLRSVSLRKLSKNPRLDSINLLTTLVWSQQA